MLAYIGKRLLQFIPVLIGAMLIMFSLGVVKASQYRPANVDFVGPEPARHIQWRMDVYSFQEKSFPEQFVLHLSDLFLDTDYVPPLFVEQIYFRGH